MEKLSKAYANKSAITLRLEKSDLNGNDELVLTKTQIKRIQKAMSLKKGVDIKISKSQIRKVARHGGSLWTSLAGLSSKVLPMAMPLVKKAAAPLITGALSGLASLGINKLFGNNQSGGFLIPDSKVKQLIQYKEYLTTKQKQDILNALQTRSGVHIKPTKKQMGSGIGMILASTGIPMLLDAIMDKGLQIDRRSRRSLPKVQTEKGGFVLPMRSDPFIGTWDQMNNPIGYGMPKNKTKQTTGKRANNWSSWYSSRHSNKQKSMVKNTSIGSDNIKFIYKPLSNFDLINWVSKLKIKHFRGVFSRDNLPFQINEPEVGILNLDSKIGPGTHWVCYRNINNHICEYFDPFGLIAPTEIQQYLQVVKR